MTDPDTSAGAGTSSSSAYGRSSLGSASGGGSGILATSVRAVRRPAPGDPDYDPLLDDDDDGSFTFGDDDDLERQGTGLLSKPSLEAKPAPRSTAPAPGPPGKGAAKRPSLSQAAVQKVRAGPRAATPGRQPSWALRLVCVLILQLVLSSWDLACD